MGRAAVPSRVGPGHGCALNRHPGVKDGGTGKVGRLHRADGEGPRRPPACLPLRNPEMLIGKLEKQTTQGRWTKAMETVEVQMG